MEVWKVWMIFGYYCDILWMFIVEDIGKVGVGV